MSSKIMVVDDSVSIRKVVAMVLGKSGHEVIESKDGVEALQKVAQENLDLIICDVNMPEMDGITFLQKMRQQVGKRDIPVIMLTTESQGRLRELGEDAGARAWILKPFQPPQLIEVVQNILG
ncbi:MAG: response regulator [bacterium]|nr:response regulator [bacterium]